MAAALCGCASTNTEKSIRMAKAGNTKLSEHFGSRFSLNAASTPVYTVRMQAGQKIADLAAELGKAL